MGLTKPVLKRPIGTVPTTLCLIVFGLPSVMESSLELTSDMNTSMMIAMAVYAGANPDDVNELVTKPIEDRAGTLSGLDTASSQPKENMSTVMPKYDYGTDMNDAHDDLRKQMDFAKVELPDDADDPITPELNTSIMPNVTMAVSHGEDDDLYNYVNSNLVPEFEKLSSVAEVSLVGGIQKHIKVVLMPKKLKQYEVTMNSITGDIIGADLIHPAGDTEVGDQKLVVSTEQPFEIMESLKDISPTISGGNIIYLGDVAEIYMGADDMESIACYKVEDGVPEDIVALMVSKQQDAATFTVSKDASKVVEQVTKLGLALQITVVNDDKDSIMSSLNSVIETMILTIIISTVVIWLFFGDLKASLIVGGSIPVFILASLMLVQLMGFSLNIITLSALVLGVGMMVDNSTVVLGSCFRAADDTGPEEYSKVALTETGVVYRSVIGSILTTCAAFLPLAMLGGMTGMMFRSLGFTTVFCMTASLVLTIAVVPLCYMIYKPTERSSAPFSRPAEETQAAYRNIIKKILKKRGFIVLASVLLLASSFLPAKNLDTKPMAESDQDQITITAGAKPGMRIDEIDQIMREIEGIVSRHPDVESYFTIAGSSGLNMSSDPNISVYLKKNRSTGTNEVVKLWKQQLTGTSDTNIIVEAYSQVSAVMGSDNDCMAELQSTNYNDPKAVSDKIAAQLSDRLELTKVYSPLENVTSIARVTVNPIKARAAGLTPAQIGGTLNNMLSGVTLIIMSINGDDVDVKVEYPKDRYKILDQMGSTTLQTSPGKSVTLTDVTDIRFVDSLTSITRQDKQYRVIISGIYTENSTKETKGQLLTDVVMSDVSGTVSITQNSQKESMVTEFTTLFQAIAPAIFLVLVVMAAQFKPSKFSITVMTTIPFCLIGAFGLLWTVDSATGMTPLLGFLMLTGTIVNNGILYVDTVNQYRWDMGLSTALIETGVTRLRSISMTTLTTVVSMVPMAMTLGDSGSTTQGPALANIGGLTASTILSLLMLSAYYNPMNGGGKRCVIISD